MNVRQAKQLALSGILIQLGVEPHHEKNGELWYLSPFRLEQEPSFKINVQKNIWYDFGLGHGGTVIDFAMQYYSLSSVSEVLRVLGNSRGLSPVAPPLPAQRYTEDSTLHITEIKPLENKSLIYYLRERGVSVEYAMPHVQEMHYTRHGKPYFSLAFANASGGFALRNRHFKGVHGTNDITIIEGKETTSMSIFEGFMDFLSLLAYRRITQAEGAVLVLNSTALKNRAMQVIREREVDTVYLYLDRDASGQKLTTAFTEDLQGVNVVDASQLYDGYKDVNDWLTTIRQSHSPA